jgi:hypothetical protein
MYRSCIFCSATLGSNDSIERFPVGRSVAFDAAKGRLWAVCPACARWNLAPIEERWEAVEDAERLFRDTRLRVQSENVGLAKLPDGTRLVRVGQALPGELAVWRYGRILLRRRTAYMAVIGMTVAAPVGLAASFAADALGGVLVFFALSKGLMMAAMSRPRLQSRSLLPYSGLAVDAGDLRRARFAFAFDGGVSVELQVPASEVVPGLGSWRDGTLVLTPENAQGLLRRGMVQLNLPGAGRQRVQAAVSVLAESGSADAFLRRAAADRAPLVDTSPNRAARSARMLAVEMAVHDELERDALRGELAALEEAWRQAEEIAGIADALPELPEPEPPRIEPPPIELGR